MNFNDFKWSINDNGTLISRWMDNGLVFCVSTINCPGKTVRRRCKRPRITNKNKAHVKAIWGDNGVVEITILCLIDNYNHWMGGVDLADQRIAYYHLNCRCLRNWIPMFIQILSLIRNNLYIMYREHFKKEAVSHKKFAWEMIHALMGSAHKYYLNEPTDISPFPHSGGSSISSSAASSTSVYTTPPVAQRNLAFQTPTPPTPSRKRYRVCPTDDKKTALAPFHKRLDAPKVMHHRVKKVKDAKTPGGRSSCVYCAIEYALDKQKGKKVTFDKAVKRTDMVCEYCNEPLCKAHFEPFHQA